MSHHDSADQPVPPGAAGPAEQVDDDARREVLKKFGRYAAAAAPTAMLLLAPRQGRAHHKSGHNPPGQAHDRDWSTMPGRGYGRNGQAPGPFGDRDGDYH